MVRKYKENRYGSLSDNRGKRKKINQMSEKEKLNAQIRLLEAKNKQLEMEIAFLKKVERDRKKRIKSSVKKEVIYTSIKELHNEGYPILLICKYFKGFIL